MNSPASTIPTRIPSRRSGQTIIIAMIVLGVVLLLGFVFLGILSHNINNGGRFKNRSIAQELAEAGIRYAHDQMLKGTMGADWRGLPTLPYATPGVNGANVTTQDPDALYTRPGTGLPYLAADATQLDQGGPDGLGFYTRVNFSNGRALVRVRYAPSDANVFSSTPTGALPAPGRARSYVIIESIGRQGVINPNDPTTMNATPVTLGTYDNTKPFDVAFTSPIPVMQTLADSEKQYPTSQKQIGLASVGIIDTALYVTNKDRVSRPADLGVPSENGATTVVFDGANYQAAPVSPQFVLGGLQPMFNLAVPATPAGNIPFGGSVWVNGDLEFNGSVTAYENYTMGDGINASGVISPADSNASLSVVRAEYEQNRAGFPAAWYGGFPATLAVGSLSPLFQQGTLDSRQSLITYGGEIRDGLTGTDQSGFPRNVRYKAPPSMEYRDPSTGALRYVTLTRESGTYVGTGNSGRFGHGSGVYVDNLDDFQIPRDDVSRAAVGGEESMIYDWTNPNNAQINSGWQGPFYSPYGSYVQLLNDGFTITRDAPKGDIDHAYWKSPDGTQSSLSFLRFRVGLGSDRQVHIVNALTPLIANINATLAATDYDKGPVFNGVLYFEGNVRIRGTIPTDVQLTVVSGATIYIEGSIVRGIVGNDVSAATGTVNGNIIGRPSKSALMLMARDYVTLNTTQFFGTGADGGVGIDYPNDLNSPDGVFPVRAQNVGDSFTLHHEFLLNPDAGGATNPYNPQTWRPYDGNYAAPGGGGPIPTELILSHAADTGSSAETFLSLSINTGFVAPSTPAAPYLFPLSSNNGSTALLPAGYTEPGYTTPGFASTYGLGFEAWQRFPQFETVGFQLIDRADFALSANGQNLVGQNTNGAGLYDIQEESTNDFTFRVNSIGGQPAGPYMLGRAAIVPSDIRIEASIYAEEGSFYVIPGQWFNPNPNDTRISYLDRVQSYETAGLAAGPAMQAADSDRLNDYGSFPEAPFYGEPIDAKITILGAVSENVTPTISQQAEYLRKWGWIPVQQGSPSLNLMIPASHQVNVVTIGTTPAYAPNLTIIYDPILGTGRVQGFAPNNDPATDPYLRVDPYGRPLAPMPRLPVSPALMYFGEQS